jgi:hypothetical protein
MPPSYLVKPILILYFYVLLGPTSGIFLTGFPTRTQYTPHPSPYVLHAPPITCVLILSPKSRRLFKCIDQAAAHYAVFCSPLFAPPSYAQLIPKHPLAYALPST